MLHDACQKLPCTHIMPTLQRTDSCTDIGFTLRRQFHKNEFRYAESTELKQELNGPYLSLSHNRISGITFFTANSVPSRPYQQEIIEAALSGHDVYVQAATSFGKSLCFQLPAVIDPGSKFTISQTCTWCLTNTSIQ